jgi:hypothetical protein
MKTKPLFLVFFLFLTSLTAISHEEKVRQPVSVNALMVTLIDHSAHYIWDYSHTSTLRGLTEHEWELVEYYAVQLAASGPLITLGGTGDMDDAWAGNPSWVRYSQEMTDVSMNALAAARKMDKEALQNAANILLDSCLACHNAFKPEIPSEGIMHDPEYDHLHHLLAPQK